MARLARKRAGEKEATIKAKKGADKPKQIEEEPGRKQLVKTDPKVKKYENYATGASMATIESTMFQSHWVKFEIILTRTDEGTKFIIINAYGRMFDGFHYDDPDTATKVAQEEMNRIDEAEKLRREANRKKYQY